MVGSTTEFCYSTELGRVSRALAVLNCEVSKWLAAVLGRWLRTAHSGGDFQACVVETYLLMSGLSRSLAVRHCSSTIHKLKRLFGGVFKIADREQVTSEQRPSPA